MQDCKAIFQHTEEGIVNMPCLHMPMQFILDAKGGIKLSPHQAQKACQYIGPA